MTFHYYVIEHNDGEGWTRSWIPGDRRNHFDTLEQARDARRDVIGSYSEPSSVHIVKITEEVVK